jgi:hypothetical protein
MPIVSLHWHGHGAEHGSRCSVRAGQVVRDSSMRYGYRERRILTAGRYQTRRPVDSLVSKSTSLPPSRFTDGSSNRLVLWAAIPPG